MDFEIDENLIKFDDTVPPELGNMNAKAQDYIKRNKSVADTASACGGELGGNYKSNNVGKAIQAFMALATGCNKIVQSLQGKLVPILAECGELAAMIAELKQLAAKGKALQQKVAALKAEKAASDEDHPWTKEAELQQAEAELAATKALFDAKHAECKAKLASLQGKDATVPNMDPTNGSLSYMPNINVDAKKGNAGLKGDYYSYSMPDQSISSISSN